VLNKNASFFEEGTSKKVPFDFLDANEWKIKIYQSSSDEMNVYGVYDVNHIDVYYTGIIELDKNKFDRSSDIYINMKQSDDGIYINLSQNLKIVSTLKI
ncbi:MAG: hypothetical protein Q4D76_16440, partial [Oscillospiraceae bacterium]|nr:hypothetical protein [Oscillospiraceae bacterium]